MENLEELFQTCRTYRRFTPQPVPESLLETLANVARTRSCGGNRQYLRFVVVSRPDLVEAMQPLVHWAACLPKEIGTPKPGEQPTAFIIILQTKDAGSFVQMDAGIALDAMAITAWQHGVGSCIMAAINRPQIARLLHVPEGLQVSMALALGYPAHTSTLVEPPADGNLNYYVDAERNYYVPKRSEEDVITVFQSEGAALSEEEGNPFQIFAPFRIYVVGGSKTWQKRVAACCPSIKVIGSSANFDASQLQNADLLILNTNFVGHAAINKARDAAPRETRVRFLSQNSMEALYDLLRETFSLYL